MAELTNMAPSPSKQTEDLQEEGRPPRQGPASPEGPQEENGRITFDHLLVQIGGSGLFQILLFSIIFCIGTFSVESIYVNFIAAKLPHWCKVPQLETLPFDVQKNVAIPSQDQNDRISTSSFSQCQMFNLNYSAYTTEEFYFWNRTQQTANSSVVDCQSGWVYDQRQFLNSIISEWDLVCRQEWQVPLVSTAYVAGMFLGAFSAGLLSDKFGRRTVLVIFTFIKMAGGIFSIFAPNYASMFVARLIIGMGSTGVYLTAFVMIVEVSSGLARTLFGTGLMVAFSAGYMLIPAIAYAIRDYRKLQIAMTGPCVIGFFLWWIVPESPRWLIVQGRYAEAEKIIKFIASINKRPLPKDFDVTKVSTEDKKNENLPKRNVIDLFRRPTIRKWTLIVYLHWFTDSLVYYALSLNSGSLAGDLFLNTFLLGLVEVPANIICMLALQWRFMGRRLTSSFSLLLAGISSLISIPLVITGAAPALTTALSMVGKAGATMAFSSIYVYTGEIFPTDVRNVAIGSASTAARISGMAAPFVGSIFARIWVGLPNLIYGFFGVVTGLLTLFLPETLGQPLYDTLDELEDARSGPAEPLSRKNVEGLPQTEVSTSQVTLRRKSALPAHVNSAYDPAYE